MTERAQANPGRRTVLGAGAAVLGAAALGLPGTANAAENTAGSADGRSGGHGHRLDLPVPTVIGHRGTSGYRPEHTLGSYQLALDMGAHIIEQDLVPTKDGHLVCRHENDITATTDVSAHPEFASRRTTKTVDGVSLTGWFTEDFTLAELKTLRAKERIPGNRQKNTLYDGRWEVPTFEEVLQWADREGRRRGKQVWLYVETKHPTYFAGIGLDLNDLLIAVLERRGVNHAGAKIMIQSMETANLKALRDRTPLTIIQLLDRQGAPYDLVAAGDPRTYWAMRKPPELQKIAAYADGIGPNKSQVIKRDMRQRLAKTTKLVRRAHDLGLLVHIWTMRSENNFLPTDLRLGRDKAAHGDAVGEYLAFFDAGVDGVFSDFSATAVLARQLWLENQ